MTTATLDDVIKSVKLAKAEKMFDDGVAVYGSLAARLRSLDCNTKQEAVQMLSVVQEVRIYKANGKVVVE